MKKLLLLLLITTFSLAQNANRKYVSNTWKKNTLQIKTNDGFYLIKPLSDNIIETSFVPNGESFNPNSHTVNPSEIKKIHKSKYADFSDYIVLSSENISVRITKNPFKITYYYTDSEVLSEKNGYVKKDGFETIEFNISSTENLYGGGARAFEKMNRRGNRLQLYNRARYGYETDADLMNFCIPLVISSNNYALHFDNPAIGYLDLDSKKNNTLTYETISGRKTYQVIVGDELVKNYTELTGRQPMPPRWAFGNFSSRFGYHSQEEVEKTIRKFKESNIPVDALILDLYWFGKTIKGTMGNLDWDKDNFPDPAKMISDLKAKNINPILITEPFILTSSSKWEETVSKKALATNADGSPATWDFYFGNTGIVDLFKPEGKDWFWNVYKRLLNQGITGLWGDLGEPEVFPSSARTAGGSADQVHNIYGHQWAKLIAEGYKKDFPNQRPFILMRAGYSGSQRYGMIPWSGDVSRSWGGLQSQVGIAVQMGMQGMAYMHSDLGGFAGDYFDNELYLRWLQYGVFTPIFRPHAQEEVASEVAYKDIVTKEKAKKQVELRYQLLPYNYTLAFNNNQTGEALMQPFYVKSESNPLQNDIKSDQYYWGNNFLIKPITHPNVTETTIQFPDDTTNWFDFNTDKEYQKNSIETIEVHQDYIPVFVRGGSFIPMIKTIQNSSEYSLDTFDLHYYFDKTVSFSDGKLYQDDGTTPNAYEKENYELLTFNSHLQGKELKINFYNQVGKKYYSINKVVNLIIHNIEPKKIWVNGKEQIYKTFQNPIVIPVTWEKGTYPEIKIEY
ncbi:glycoside hydrolase family 31 protein [Flavobacterium aciduliphilum]|uniref:Oligosaccharide 4-alpha-D-glucosyltransferase n=1 Tax=Flavobacterium aciduliphilum TaxID=1101402 RepID=A0A328YLU1_9FLAO|nr:TIM-barrel domain-containing protein [Flavobacterium aciduliphilum]RAR74083.1 oligosaccharide 4-alpha-D-glucosyltransferase [Flavobacterium aciduliphilum]